MFVEKNVTPYVVYGEDPVLRALEKITANKSRVVFVVSEHGYLLGSLSDGDFRRWISQNHDADLSAATRVVANPGVRSAPMDTPPADISSLFTAGIQHIPLLDRQGHLVAIAINVSSELRIGRHLVSADAPTVVISEIGNNHQGSVDFARRLVDLSVEAGADIVKFQLRDMDALYRQSGAASAGEDLGPQYVLDLLAKYNLPANDLFRVFDHCRDVGIGLMCTAWDLPSVTRLADYGVDAFKVASADLTNHDLLRAMATRSRPMIVSTGMSTEDEIRETVSLLRGTGASYALLHCQSTYPAPFKDINLRYLTRLQELGQCPVGYSGHERGFHVALASVALGARVIEKHFTIDRTLEGNDHKVSLLPGEFQEMVARIRETEESLGSDAPRAVSTGEMMNRVNLAKSLVSTRDLVVDEVVSADDVTVRSPGRGLQPNSIGRLVGRRMTRDIDAGDFFYPADLTDEPARARPFSFRRPWGLPVRYHDYARIMSDSNPDFLEFHLSYKDMELDPGEYIAKRLSTFFTVHLPDLFSGDFLVNLGSYDDIEWERSIVETQRTLDLTRRLRDLFTCENDPVMIATLGGFTKHGHLPAEERPRLYERVAAGLDRLDADGVRLCAQTLPPFPWLMGGQQFHNLFMDPSDTATFAAEYEVPLCLDISHTKLAANFVGMSFTEAVDLVAPHTEHLHMVDATGVDGEGVQVGEGEVDFAALAEQLDRLCPGVPFIPEIWQGHVNYGEGFWVALERLEKWF